MMDEVEMPSDRGDGNAAPRPRRRRPSAIPAEKWRG